MFDRRHSLRWLTRAALAWCALAAVPLARAENQPQRLIDRLDPETRGRVTLALAGLVLVGALLLSLTWLAFRMVRRNIQISRQVAERQGPTRVDDDRWSRKPLTKNPE